MRVWQAWRTLQSNPVYLREKGHWGNPNPFYAQLMRYSPFLVIGAILFGACAGGTNLPLLGGDDDLAAALCFLCLPGFLLTAVTLYAQFMAPALTAPSISLERANGAWDILRVTPISMQHILLAKLFGGLARLRVWPLLFALSLLHGAIMALSVTAFGGEQAVWGWLLGLFTAVRPWSEVIFAAFVGMFMSTVVQSAMIALVGAYSVIALVKLFNSSALWLAALLLLNPNSSNNLLPTTLGPVLVYGLLITAVWLGIVQQAKKLSYG